MKVELIVMVKGSKLLLIKVYSILNYKGKVR